MIRDFSKVIHIKKCQLQIHGDIADKNYFDLLQQEIAEYKLTDLIKFAGFIDNPYAYMAKADLFVLTSKWEGLANVLIEALACGCPVISDRKSTRLNSSHVAISYAVFCLKTKMKN